MQRYTFIYPPTVSWNDSLYQRPHQLMAEFVRQGHNAVFCNAVNDGKGDFYRVLEGPNGSALWVVNNVHNFLLDKRVFDKVAGTKKVFWCSYPPAWTWGKMFNPDIKVFDIIDEPTDEFAGWKANYTTALNEADVLTCTAQRLYDMVKKDYWRKPILLSNNGSDVGHFDFHRTDLRTPPIVKKLRGRKNKPLIGFHGAIASWLDFPLMREVAKMRPDYEFLYIGPEHTEADLIHGVKNITLIGTIPYAELNHYVHHFDVGLIPFQVRDMTNSVNACKLHEYMAAGVPIVSTPIKECLEDTPLIECGATPDEFAKAIDLQLSRKQSDDRIMESLFKVAQRNSWTNKCTEVLEVLDRRF